MASGRWFENSYSSPFAAETACRYRPCHDERVVQFAAVLQQLQHADQVAVEVLQFEGVVQQIVADHVVVGPERGHLADVGEPLASFGNARAVFVAAVRLGAAVPEAPRLFLGRASRNSWKLAV